jgi:hypothetical protein
MGLKQSGLRPDPGKGPCGEHAGAPRYAPRKRQRGEFTVGRILALTGILILMLLVPLYFLKNRDAKMAAQEAQERAQNSQVQQPVAASATPAPAASVAPAAPAAAAASTPGESAAAGPATIGLGLTYGVMPAPPGQTAPVVHVSCHGEPKPGFDEPHRGSCNPYKGDTTCRAVLPVLCYRAGGEPKPASLPNGFYEGWNNGELGLTQPVMGAVLKSRSAADARCAAELGEGWSMADFHAGGGGWGQSGWRHPSLRDGSRFWVHVADQPGNCWDAKP